nr:MAG TPA: hypothetical protein [Caudoviricetes sp.]
MKAQRLEVETLQREYNTSTSAEPLYKCRVKI